MRVGSSSTICSAKLFSFIPGFRTMYQVPRYGIHARIGSNRNRTSVTKEFHRNQPWFPNSRAGSPLIDATQPAQQKLRSFMGCCQLCGCFQTRFAHGDQIPVPHSEPVFMSTRVSSLLFRVNRALTTTRCKCARPKHVYTKGPCANLVYIVAFMGECNKEPHAATVKSKNILHSFLDLQGKCLRVLKGFCFDVVKV